MNLPPEHPRQGAEFFLQPSLPAQRRYEALRAYFVEHASLGEAAQRVGYSINTLTSLVRDFRSGDQGFFLQSRPGPKSAPAKEAARPQVVRLRRQGLSVYEIEDALKDSPTPLNRTGIAEILREEGFARFQRRPQPLRGGQLLEPLVTAEAVDFRRFPAHFSTDAAGLFLAIPELVGLGLPGLVSKAGYPSTAKIPALGYLLSMLALKLSAKRRLSHVKTLAHDPGYGLFAGLAALPKTTAISTYSYRCAADQQKQLLSGLDQQLQRQGLSAGSDFDLDFHAVMHYGNDPVLEQHYVPRRSQRTASVLTFFAHDATSRSVVYANADLLKATRNEEVLRFCEHWRQATDRYPSLVVLDSKVTSHAVLSRLNDLHINFLSLRPRHPALIARLDQLPASAWISVQAQRADGLRRVQIYEQLVGLPQYQGKVRQIAVRGLGRDNPIILITNDSTTRAKLLFERYARRMGIEQRLAEWIQAFHLDSLSSAVPLNVDLDVVLSVLAGIVCEALRQRLPGYAKATPDTLQQRFLTTGGDVSITDREVLVTLAIRAYSPVLRQAAIPSVQVPWWGGRRLVLRQA